MPTPINPYDLLGVTTETPIEDVCKAFRALALVHHEDKGGDKEAMIMLNSAYAFVMRELRHRDHVRAKWTPARIKEEFDEFLQSQKDIGPALKTFDPDMFNKVFDDLPADKVFTPSLPEGYGTVMDASEADRDAASLNKPVSHRIELVISDKDEVSTGYTSKAFSQVMDLTQREVAGFGAVTPDGLRMNDYLEAFSPPAHPPVTIAEVPMDEKELVAAAQSAESRRRKIKPATSSMYDFARRLGRLMRLEW